jgi:hypothetical protein
MPVLWTEGECSSTYSGKDEVIMPENAKNARSMVQFYLFCGRDDVILPTLLDGYCSCTNL